MSIARQSDENRSPGCGPDQLRPSMSRARRGTLMLISSGRAAFVGSIRGSRWATALAKTGRRALFRLPLVAAPSSIGSQELDAWPRTSAFSTSSILLQRELTKPSSRNWHSGQMSRLNCCGGCPLGPASYDADCADLAHEGGADGRRIHLGDRSREAELSSLRNGSRRVGSMQSDGVAGEAGAASVRAGAPVSLRWKPARQAISEGAVPRRSAMKSV